MRLIIPMIIQSIQLLPQRPLQVTPPLRVLGMVARPGDQQTLAVDDERRRLRQALAELERAGRVELSWVAGQTWRELRDAMRRGPWHIFHFIGHGGFDAAAGEGTLALAGDGGRTYALHASGLAMLLRGHPSLRLRIDYRRRGARKWLADPRRRFFTERPRPRPTWRESTRTRTSGRPASSDPA